MINIKGYETVGEYELDEVLPYVSEDKGFKKAYGEYNVKLCSVRLVTFKCNHVCVCCGLAGSKMLLQKGHGQSSPHFNMYAVTSDGEYILMTKDHILAKSNGGSDHISNMQTMCSVCNEFKGSMPLKLEHLRTLVHVYNGPYHNLEKLAYIKNFLKVNDISPRGDFVNKILNVVKDQ